MNYRKILVVRNDRIGDLLMSLPAIHLLRQAFPKATVYLLLEKGLEPLLEGHPDVDRILKWDPKEGRGWWAISRLAWRLRKYHFDAAVILNPSRLFHAVSFLSAIPVRVGYHRKWGFLLTKSCADTKSMRDRHESEYNVEIVSLFEEVSSKKLGLSRINPISLPIHLDSEEFVRKVLNDHLPERTDLVAVHPWTTNSKNVWDIDKFIEVINNLLKENVTVLVIGGPEEMVLWSKHKIRVGDKVLDLVGHIPLRHLPALLHLCAVLVSNSSGPAHIAAVVGTPTVVVGPDSFKPNSQRWHPLGSNHVTLISPSVDQVVSAVRDRIPPHSPFVSQQCVS